MAFFVLEAIDAVEALTYIAGQILGGFVGGLILFVIYRPQFKASTTPLAPLTGNPDPKDVVQNVITSVLGSFFLALLVVVTVNATSNLGGITPLAVGAAVLAAALAVGGTAYSVLNVARDLGPRLTATVLGLGKPTWIPVLLLAVASLVGGALAGLVVTLLG
jgi:glycerol uptake facilitator protein